MKTSLFLVFCLISTILLGRPSSAANFEVEIIDLRPIRELTIHIKMSGQIEAGDAAVLSSILIENQHLGMRDILFLMDSPGGNLLEGLAIGQIIASLQQVTSAQVGSNDNPDAICASACVLAYLGADYRYLSERGRIGVHRFGAPGTDMDAAEALSLAQELSAKLTEFLRAQRADPAFYVRMTETPFEGINWVERELLEEWRVVTGPVYDEWSEYRNVNGAIALQLSQRSLYGDNSLTLICGSRGLVGVAKLNKPELAMFGRLELAVDGDALTIADYDILDQDETFVNVGFSIPPAHSSRLAVAKSFGARILLPSEFGFFGFEMRIRDAKLNEMVRSCPGGRDTDVAAPRMRPIWGMDFPGGDLTSSGVRGISFDECTRLCVADTACRAVSYVTNLEWCWPKFEVGEYLAVPGIVSAVK